MVYPGGPSKGCYTCRARKVKCDEARPVCKRCIKGNRICGGYRILDESKKTTVARRSRPGSGAGLMRMTAEDPIAQQLADLALSPASLLGQNRDQERANLCSFYSRLVCLPQVQGLHGGLLSVTTLPAILASLRQPVMRTSPLPAALSALLLTFVSEKNNERHYGAVTKAMACYGNALKLTRRLMEGYDEDRRGELVMTVFILGMYEDLNSNEDHVRTTSNSHLEGAMAFVRSQKCKSFGEDTSRRIYSALLNRALLTCFNDLTDTTPFIFTLTDLQLLHGGLQAESKPDYLNLYNCALLIIHIQLRKLELDIWNTYTSNPTDSPAIDSAFQATALLSTIASTEHQMAEWPSTLPVESQYVTIQLRPEECIDLWSTEAHIYPSFTAGNDWSRYRMLQILACSLRLRVYRILANPLCNSGYGSGSGSCGGGVELNEQLPSPSLASDIAITHANICSLADDICASMPYHLGYRTGLDSEVRYPSESFPDGRYPRLLSACHIMWPLYVAGIVEGVDPAQRLWISRQLAFISGEMGIGKAAVLGGLVRRAAFAEPLSIV
ncbi:Zn(II)2Cys6 transcription factor domain-containing protein [Aspergillus stella-maris]|uniref:Zn(II)2Cys6 transcription factor domain-containing protein n=1 Tax=Aspergillus stella-maris TaxID=1810926 RepID=UPI003CCCE159